MLINILDPKFSVFENYLFLENLGIIFVGLNVLDCLENQFFRFLVFSFENFSTEMTDRDPSTVKNSDAERQPGLPVAANEETRESFTVSDLLAYHDANPQSRKSNNFHFSRQNFIIFVDQHCNMLFIAHNDDFDPYGRTHVWLPYGRHVDLEKGVNEVNLYSRYCIPLDTDAYEVGFACVPLSMSDGTSTTTTSATTTATTPSKPLALTAEQHSEHFQSGTVPPHLALYYAPKVVKVGTTLRVCQLRYNRSTNAVEWMCLAHALAPTTSADAFKPKLRIKCASLEKKFTYEDILKFLRHYNIESDGTFYAASADTSNDAAGYTRVVTGKDGSERYVTTSFPDKDCKYLFC